MKANEEKILNFINSQTSPFTLDEVFEITKIKKNKQLEKNFLSFLHYSNDFIEDNDVFYPKLTFLPAFSLRIQLTPFELENQLFILGHRIIPFNFGGLKIENIQLFHKRKLLERKIKKIPLEELMIFYSLLDIEKSPFVQIDLHHDPKQLVRTVTYNLGDFFKEYQFQPEDAIIIRVKDMEKGEYVLEYESVDVQKENFLINDTVNQKFFEQLKKVVSQRLMFPSVEKQLLYTFYQLGVDKAQYPFTSVGPLLRSQNDIILNMLPDGTKVFLLKGQKLEDLGIFPDFDEIEKEIEESEIDLDSIDGILHYLGNTNTETTVRAFLYVQNAFGSYNYEEVIDYLFQDCQKPYFYDDLEEVFKLLLAKTNTEILQIYKKHPPLLPINVTRKSILKCLLKISCFLRSLDHQQIPLAKLPKEEMYTISSINSNLDEMLYFLENQKSEPKDIKEIEHLNNTIKLFSEKLPEIFESIRMKIKNQ
ncbi:MAG: hypothetical protein MJB14_23145 [Spirochaetes bacterium]|nr:hypothetical protein [Spirochaetota bacterium]